MLHAHLQQHLHNALHAGTVRSVDSDVVLIVGQAGLVSAMRAESCLLAPQVHDTVLFVLLDDGSAWVLSVLRRNGGEEACLRLPKNTNLATQALRIKTAETEFEAESLRLQGQEIRLTGQSVSLSARFLVLSGQILMQGFTVVRSFVRSLIERVVRRKAVYESLDERVQGLAKFEADRVRQKVATSFRLRAEHADLRAKEQVVLDAKHIKVG